MGSTDLELMKMCPLRSRCTWKVLSFRAILLEPTSAHDACGPGLREYLLPSTARPAFISLQSSERRSSSSRCSCYGLYYSENRARVSTVRCLHAEMDLTYIRTRALRHEEPIRTSCPNHLTRFKLRSRLAALIKVSSSPKNHLSL